MTIDNLNNKQTWIVSGRDEINSLFLNLINKTEKYWGMVAPARGASLFYYMVDLKLAYKKALKRGIKIHAISEVTKDNTFYVKDRI